MPRTRQRFSRLIDELRASKGTAAAGTRAKDFQNFLTGINKVTMPRRPDSAAMARFGVSVLPFGITPGATPIRYLASMTNQAELLRVETAVQENRFGIDKTLNNAVRREDLYKPAYCKIFMALTGAVSTPKQSDILKSNPAYKRTIGRSGSIPFGRTLTGVGDAASGTAETAVADVDEEDVKRSLALELKGKVGATRKVRSVSFVSELWLSPRNAPGPIGTLPASIQAG